jgi:hypothetical protein
MEGNTFKLSQYFGEYLPQSLAHTIPRYVLPTYLPPNDNYFVRYTNQTTTTHAGQGETMKFSILRSMFIVLSLTAGMVQAQDQEHEEPVLTISHTDYTRSAVSLTLADLQNLPTSSFSTTTIWTEGESLFTGVSLHALLEHMEHPVHELRAVALNDYAVSIPVGDAIDGGPIVAYLRDGAPMSLREKGPLWILYPFDDKPKYQSEEYFTRSIWQLSHIELVSSH